MATVQERLQRDSPEVATLLRGPTDDFSLVLGGPVFQLLRRLHLEGDAAELMTRRIIVITGMAWLPLLVLSSIAGPGVAVHLSFLRDIEVHARFLVALPVLIWAEKIVNERITKVASAFVDRQLVPPKDLPRFSRAVESAIRLRNSIALEVGLLGFVYAFGLWLWNSRVAPGSPTWFELSGGRWDLSMAGYWYVFVSLPIAQFILLRWDLRLFIWYRLLWQVSRLDLNLLATHPDRAAGIGFLGRSAYAFGPILFAQGAMLAGVLADRVLYQGDKLMSFQLQFAGFITFFVLAVLGPLVMFTPRMARTKRKALAEYGQLAQEYTEQFDRKWVRKESRSPDDELLGTGDIQSLADLGNSYEVVQEMRLIPFGWQDVVRLALPTAAPFAPLLLTVYSPEELLVQIIKMLF